MALRGSTCATDADLPPGKSLGPLPPRLPHGAQNRPVPACFKRTPTQELPSPATTKDALDSIEMTPETTEPGIDSNSAPPSYTTGSDDIRADGDEGLADESVASSAPEPTAPEGRKAATNTTPPRDARARYAAANGRDERRCFVNIGCTSQAARQNTMELLKGIVASSELLGMASDSSLPDEREPQASSARATPRSDSKESRDAPQRRPLRHRTVGELPLWLQGA